MKKLLLVALLSFFIGSNSYSQSLSIDTIYSAIQIPDTVNYGQIAPYNIRVVYNGPGTFSGMIYLVAGVDSSGGVQSVDTVASQLSFFTFNGDSDTLAIVDTFNNNYGYRFGGNVVVIWPVASTLTTLDTFQTNVFVIQSVGINENKALYNSLSVYPNPSKNYIYIDKLDKNISIKRVRIYNLGGQLIYNERFKLKINISNLSKGLYFLKLETDKGETLNYKLIKE